jgi:hypothetical protein
VCAWPSTFELEKRKELLGTSGRAWPAARAARTFVPSASGQALSVTSTLTSCHQFVFSFVSYHAVAIEVVERRGRS